MEQARFEELMRNFQAQCSAQGIQELEAFAAEPGMPIVVLVHGIGGNARHWADPVSLNVSETWLFNIDAQPTTDKNGLGVSPNYKEEETSTWTNFLRSSNISYVNFSQSKSGGLIQFAVDELTMVLTQLEQLVLAPYDQDVAQNGGQTPPLIILAHSRGGLVTRHVLKKLGKSGLPHLQKVITICTPHTGSYMPKLANDYNNFLHSQIKIDIGLFKYLIPPPLQPLAEGLLNDVLTQLANLVRESMLHSFGTMATSPGFDELIPDSAMFKALHENEEPLPGVEYHGFGGSQPNFVNFFLLIAGQAFKIFGTASSVLIDLLGKIPGVHETYDGLGELIDGDSAVAVKRSYWPAAFKATHQNVHLNHMQILIDINLQNEVMKLISPTQLETFGSASF